MVPRRSNNFSPSITFPKFSFSRVSRPYDEFCRSERHKRVKKSEKSKKKLALPEWVEFLVFPDFRFGNWHAFPAGGPAQSTIICEGGACHVLWEIPWAGCHCMLEDAGDEVLQHFCSTTLALPGYDLVSCYVNILKEKERSSLFISPLCSSPYEFV